MILGFQVTWFLLQRCLAGNLKRTILPLRLFCQQRCQICSRALTRWLLKAIQYKISFPFHLQPCISGIVALPTSSVHMAAAMATTKLWEEEHSPTLGIVNKLLKWEVCQRLLFTSQQGKYCIWCGNGKELQFLEQVLFIINVADVGTYISWLE